LAQDYNLIFRPPAYLKPHKYIRADIHDAAIEAAEQRGYARGIESGVAKLRLDADNGDISSGAAQWAIDTIRALSPTPPMPVVPKVNPLVWNPAADTRGFIATTKTGIQYAVFDEGSPRWAFAIRGGYKYHPTDSIDEAKAAAQADHEIRILSQIDTAPVTVQEAARVLRDAPELMEGWSEDGWADICALAEQEGE
jgi:hypothetical protein